MRWWRRLFRRSQLEREVDAELRYHFDRLVDDHVRTGVPQDEARRLARLEFGGLQQTKESCRDIHNVRWMHDLAYDVRFGIRLLMKERWFTATAVLGMALGMAVPAMMTSILNGYYFRGLPGAHADRLLYIGTAETAGPDEPAERGLSYPEFQELRALSRSFADVVAFGGGVMAIGGAGVSPENVDGRYVSATTFGLLGVKPALGRTFRQEDERPGAPPVVILAHHLWMTRYDGNGDVIGRSVRVNGETASIIGVMPDGFGFPYLDDLWLPLSLLPGISRQTRDDRSLGVLGLLSPGASPAQAAAELDAIATSWAAQHPRTNGRISLRSTRFGQQQVGRFGQSSVPLMLAATALLVLAIACVNVANLLLARCAGRAREIAVRAALGATRWRIIRQLLVESLIVAALASLMGVAISRLGVDFVSNAFEGYVPYWMAFTLDGQVLGVLVILCILAALASGLMPALYLSRTDGNGYLRETGRAGRRARRMTTGLVAGEVALALAIVAGAGLMVRSFLVLYRADQVIDTESLLTLRVVLPERAYPSSEARAAFHERLLGHLRTSPPIAAASTTTTPPYAHAPRRALWIRGRPAGAEGTSSVAVVATGPRYFETLRLPLLRGHEFAEPDQPDFLRSAIVNQRLADLHFPGEDPIGRQIRLTQDEQPGDTPWLMIVGVAPTIRQAFEWQPAVYVPLQQHVASSATLIVRSSDVSGAVGAMRREIARLDPEVSVFSVRPLREIRDDSRLQPRLLGTLLSAFAGIGLGLSALGIYSVTAYAVRQRIPEIGIRLALGAGRRQIVWLFIRGGLIPIALGVAIGVSAALVVGFLLRTVLIQTSPADPASLAAGIVLLAAIGVAACAVPAGSAARVEPATVLRRD